MTVYPAAIHGESKTIYPAIHLPITIVPSASITLAYVQFTPSFPLPVAEIYFKNNTNETIDVSLNYGEYTCMQLLAGEVRQWTYKSNRTVLAAYIAVFLKADTVVPTVGSFNIECIGVS